VVRTPEWYNQETPEFNRTDTPLHSQAQIVIRMNGYRRGDAFGVGHFILLGDRLTVGQQP